MKAVINVQRTVARFSTGKRIVFGSRITKSDTGLITVGNIDSVTISAGMAVALDASGVGMRRADAALSTRPTFGIVTADVGVGFSIDVRTQGHLQLQDWTAAIGSPSLVPISLYYTSALTPGMLTTSPPATPGQFSQCVGRAIGAKTLDINIQESIKRN